MIPYPSEHGQGVGPSATAVDGDFYNIGVTLKHRCCVGHCCCETFRLDRRKPRQSWNSPNERGFVCDGTKTAFRPYDIAVTAALLIAKRHLSDHLTIHSNGADAQWRDAKSLCQNVLGYGDWFGIVEEEVEDELPANIATSEGVSRWRTVRQRTLVGSARPVLLE